MTEDEQLSPAAQFVLDTTSRAKCIQEWCNVNDPPCHPSDLDWKGCAVCRDTAIPAAVLREVVDQLQYYNCFEGEDMLLDARAILDVVDELEAL
jgi:hypothetical protein